MIALTISVDNDTLNDWEEAAHREGVSVSEWVRRMVKRGQAFRDLNLGGPKRRPLAGE